MKQDFWKDRNVFITGATGLLGSWMVKTLLDSGANVVGLVRDHIPHSNHFYSGNHSRMMAVQGDLADIHVLERIMNEYEIDTVFHTAAQTQVGIANTNPLSTFESNIKGTWNLLEAARRNPVVKRIVTASSDKAYGQQKVLPYSEESPLIGLHPYDVSKSCSDLLAQTYHNTYRLPVCVTRCGNFFGGGDLNFNRIVPGTIKSVLNGKAPIIRSDGKMTRDYIYIEDGVEAYIHLAEKMAETDLGGHAFNFSNESPMNVLEITNKILKIMGSDFTPVILNQAKHEIPEQYLSAQKAREMLDWKPFYGVDEGLARTVEWYKQYFYHQSQAVGELEQSEKYYRAVPLSF
jgi:CDP-glucose 4,6-dehydratase